MHFKARQPRPLERAVRLRSLRRRRRRRARARPPAGRGGEFYGGRAPAPVAVGEKKKKKNPGAALSRMRSEGVAGAGRERSFSGSTSGWLPPCHFPRGPGSLAATRSVLSDPCFWRKGSLFTSSIQDFSSSHETIITRRHRYPSLSKPPRHRAGGGVFRPSAQPLCRELRGKGRGACITASLALRARTLYKDDFLYKRLFVEAGRGC